MVVVIYSIVCNFNSIMPIFEWTPITNFLKSKSDHQNCHDAKIKMTLDLICLQIDSSKLEKKITKTRTFPTAARLWSFFEFLFHAVLFLILEIISECATFVSANQISFSLSEFFECRILVNFLGLLISSFFERHPKKTN